MNQKFSWAAFVAGLSTFLLAVAELLTMHKTWDDLISTPIGAAHLFLIGAAFAALVAGALGVQLPRASGRYGDRATDPQPAMLSSARVVSTLLQGVSMSKWGRFLAVAGRLAPMVLRETPLAPIADEVGKAIGEAQQIEGASGKDKLAHVRAIAISAAKATNAKAGRIVLDPVLVEAEADSAISTTVQAIHLVKDAHPTPPAEVLAPTTEGAVPEDVPTD